MVVICVTILKMNQGCVTRAQEIVIFNKGPLLQQRKFIFFLKIYSSFVISCISLLLSLRSIFD